MRVAVSQFATSSNTQQNLESCIRIINKAATCNPTLIVLPEYCNTLFSNLYLEDASNTTLATHHSLTSDTCHEHNIACYTDQNQAWEEALTLDGLFIKTIAKLAQIHHCYIVLNATLRQPMSNDVMIKEQSHTSSHECTNILPSNISVTSFLFSPLGELISQINKQRLSALERRFFTSDNQCPKTIKTSAGILGFLMGDDEMALATSRTLALEGAQLLCHSASTNTVDQSELHTPTRAYENNVFIASANKTANLTSFNQVPKEGEEHLTLHTGHSQIISPEGKILAKLAHNQEGFTYADINLSSPNESVIPLTTLATTHTTTVGLKNNYRPDGTHFLKQLRPKLYSALTEKAPSIHSVCATHKLNNVPITANVGIFATYKSNEQAIEDVCQYIENNLTDIIQLPELFFIADKTITHDPLQRAKISRLSQQLIIQVSSVLRPFQYVSTSLIIDDKHQAVLISHKGLLATQQQLHFCQRYQWSELGHDLAIISLPLEQGNINVAMLTADDANIPEMINIAALNNTQLLLIALDIQAPSEVAYCLPSRAAENRVCIVAASREKTFGTKLSIDKSHNNVYSKNKEKEHKSTGLIVNLSTSPDLLPQWRPQKFNGYINQPLIKLQYGKITKAVIHPIAACTKLP